MKVNKKQVLELSSNHKGILNLSFVMVLLFSLILLPLFGKGTYSNETTGAIDGLSIVCDETTLKGSEFSCSIKLNSISMNTQGLTFKYKITDGMEFLGFTSESFTSYNTSEDGVVLINLDGVNGEVFIGDVKFKIPVDADVNDIYKVELIDISIGDGEDTVKSLNNVFDETIIKSNVSTLDSITLVNGEFNKVIDIDVKNQEYSVSVNLDELSISVVATDENSVVSGITDENVKLHYGTNTYEILVTSEDGTDNTYVLNILRVYEFNSNNTEYLYNNVDKFIYVGNDSDDIILNNISIPSELSMDIHDNKLIISYDKENVLEIDILRVSFGNYSVVDKNITINKDISYKVFMTEITKSEKLGVKVFNNGVVVEDTNNLLDGMILEIYYDDIKLDSYMISVDSYELEFDKSLTIDNVNKYIKYLSIGTSVENVIKKVLISNGDVCLYDRNGKRKDNSSVVATGDILKIYFNEVVIDEYTISVIGDASGDGKLSSLDLSQIKRHLVGWVNPSTGVKFNMTGVYKEAFDLNKDGKISILDISIMRKTLVGLI